MSVQTSDIKETERIQKRAIKLIITLKTKPFHLNLAILKYRRSRDDMIKVYKILIAYDAMQQHHLSTHSKL